MDLLELTDNNFDQEVIQSNVPVLVDFWAHWCGPCKMLTPVIEEIADDYSGKIKVGKVNADSNMKLTQGYHICGLPTLLIFKDGQEVERITGMKSKQEITDLIDKHLVP